MQHHLAGLNYAIFTALSFLSIRELKRYYDTRSVVMSFMLTGVVASIISMILGEWITIIAGFYDREICDATRYAMVLGIAHGAFSDGRTNFQYLALGAESWNRRSSKLQQYSLCDDSWYNFG
jgi:lipopolysaccharide export LptBFGC system permease protein LptF